jgi:hypothetical protein
MDMKTRKCVQTSHYIAVMNADYETKRIWWSLAKIALALPEYRGQFALVGRLMTEISFRP